MLLLSGSIFPSLNNFIYFQKVKLTGCVLVVVQLYDVSPADCFRLISGVSLFVCVWKRTRCMFFFLTAGLSLVMHAALLFCPRGCILKEFCRQGMEVLHIQSRAVHLDKTSSVFTTWNRESGPRPVDQPAALDLPAFQGEFSGKTGTNPVCKKSQVEGLSPVVLSAST